MRTVVSMKLVGLILILLAGVVSLAGQTAPAPPGASSFGVNSTCNLDPGFLISLPDPPLDPKFLLLDPAPTQPGDTDCPQIVPLR